MEKPQNNYAFIDSQNLNLSIRSQGRKTSEGSGNIFMINTA